MATVAMQRLRPDAERLADEEVPFSRVKRLKVEEGDVPIISPTLEQQRRYTRDKSLDVKPERNARRQRHLNIQKRLREEAVRRLAASELLLTETQGFIEPEAGEHTAALKQKDILDSLDVGTNAKAFDLALSFGPYKVDYTRNGKYMLIGGQKGSLSVLDCHTMKCLTELNVRETVRDVAFLHDQTLWAAAQKKYVYIYDQNGIELHCLREHMLTYQMEFLPYHFLLATVGEFGELRWIDVSTGLVPAAYKTKQGPCYTMWYALERWLFTEGPFISQNPATAVLALGHLKGCVSLWTPNVGKPVVQFLGHRGKITCLEHLGQHYVATAGLDGYWKVWDLRKFEPLHWHRYYGGVPKDMSASQTGLLSVGFSTHVQVWKDATAASRDTTNLYMTHNTKGAAVESLMFRPYEDFLCVGTTRGVESIVIPGSCFSNYDSYSADPYETKGQRREREVHALLEKLPASTITFDPTVLGGLDEAPKSAILKEKEEASEKDDGQERQRHKSKRKSKTAAKEHLRRKKYAELLTKKRERDVKDQMKQRRMKEEEEEDENDAKGISTATPKEENALARFRKKEKPVYT